MKNAIDQDRIVRFARAAARMQRRCRTPYQSDAQIEATLRGWIRCYSVLFGQQIVLAEDISAAIHAFRRTRRLEPRTDRSQRSLLVVADGAKAAA